VKAIITSLTTDADGSAGDLLVPERRPMVDPVERKLTVRDLMTPGRTSAMAIQYPKETGFTNNAAVASESSGAAKAQSEMKFDLVTETVVTIAHWVLAHRNILADAPMLASYIDGRLRYGLGYVEDNALLNGAGSPDLNGIYTQATTSTANLAVVASADVPRRAAGGDAAGLAGEHPAHRHRPQSDRLVQDRDDQGHGGRLYHRQSGRTAPIAACGVCRWSRPRR
jgi:HK97 family phage major capsid protein